VYSVRKAPHRVDNRVDGLVFHIKFHVFTEHINYSILAVASASCLARDLTSSPLV